MTQLNVDRRYSIEQMRGQFLETGKTAGQNVTGLKSQSFAEILEAAQQKRRCTVVITGDGISVFELVLPALSGFASSS